jgi:alanyl-tRNA synthetase
MTKKLFWINPYQTTCTAKVTQITGNIVKLNQTILYAFSGGQESDQGTINDIKVISATKLGDKENIIDIEYELESKPNFKVDDEVEVVIDKDRRENLMKLHSAAHIAYYFLVEKYGKQKIIGSNIAQNKARVDFARNEPLTELDEVEQKLNTYLEEGHDISRYQDEKNEDLWWWSCSLGKMPCGGTHVKNTKEIGHVTIKRKTKGKGKERVEIILSN